MENSDLRPDALAAPFAPEDILSRDGPGGRRLAYVSGEKVVRRLLEAAPDFTWEILSVAHTEDARGKKLWQVRGRLSIPGLGSRDGIGTQLDETEDSVKGAAKDALKVAASLFGVALDLYSQERKAPATRTAQGMTGRTLNDTGSPCPSCHAPDGKHHSSNCPG